MRASLTAKLVVLTTALAVAGVVAGFFVVTLVVRSHTKKLLASTLSHHQGTLSHLQRESLEGMVRTSSLLADSPTLRAALETYAGEEKPDARIAAELVATVQAEPTRWPSRSITISWSSLIATVAYSRRPGDRWTSRGPARTSPATRSWPACSIRGRPRRRRG
jgi:hypothetical protein